MHGRKPYADGGPGSQQQASDCQNRESAYAFNDQARHSVQVVEIIQILQKAFHRLVLANNRQHRADGFRIGAMCLRFIH